MWRTYMIPDKPAPRGKSAMGVALYGHRRAYLVRTDDRHSAWAHLRGNWEFVRRCRCTLQ
jgi:hypothetical protein